MTEIRTEEDTAVEENTSLVDEPYWIKYEIWNTAAVQKPSNDSINQYCVFVLSNMCLFSQFPIGATNDQ